MCKHLDLSPVTVSLLGDLGMRLGDIVDESHNVASFPCRPCLPLCCSTFSFVCGWSPRTRVVIMSVTRDDLLGKNIVCSSIIMCP